MNKLIVIGNTEHALTMMNYIMTTDFGEIVAFAVNEKYITDNEINGIPVIAIEKLAEYYGNTEVKLVLGVGYNKMGAIKESLFNSLTDRGYDFVNYIHPTAIISKDVVLGTGNNILEGVILESGVKIGNGNLLFGGSMIAHDTEVGNFNSFSVKSVVAGCSKVSNNCFVGANATVRDHLIIDDYVLIGAGAYADKSLEKYSVLAAQKSVLLEGKKSTDFI